MYLAGLNKCNHIKPLIFMELDMHKSLLRRENTEKDGRERKFLK